MNDWKYCQKIMKKHGKGYYFATKFFPKEIRLGTYGIYAWTRIPDDIVDIENDKDKLENWINVWHQCENGAFTNNPEMKCMIWARNKFSIPKELNDAFIDSMLLDTYKRDYENMQGLQKYMYGSATSVGIMMMYVFGNFQTIAIPFATDLAEAMQLTNFLRDIKEDYETKNRIYLPQDELKKFNLTEENIKNKNLPKEFIKFKINQARELFKKSRDGIKYLPKKVRFSILLSSYLYEAILDEIEKQNYDVFVRRAKTTFWQKIIITFRTYLWYRKNM